MKISILILAVLSTVSADFAAQGDQRPEQFAEYFAGVDLIVSDKSLDPLSQARRYRRLREITGVSGEKAKRYLRRFESDPAGWQKFETMVMELLQEKAQGKGPKGESHVERRPH